MGNTDLKLIQIFLSQSTSALPAVFEVSAKKDHSLFCTCPGYGAKGTCKHTRFVKARIDNNRGTYPLEISSKATTEDIESSKTSNKDFRDFVIKFGKIEVF